ncbi:MAG: 4a-hydroxytetrahydrobiopterin dehydratase [Planctomycetota bacterium]
MADLAQRSCVPCQGGIPPLAADESERLSSQLDAGWEVIANHHLMRNFEFTDFASALEFVNRVGQLAEREGHHPEIYLTWGRVGIQLWTHKVDGLTESDFILAAKIDQL